MRDLKRLAEQQVIQGCIFRSIGAADYENICKLPIVCCGMSSMRIPGAAYFFNENLVRRSFEALQMSGCRTFGVSGAFSFDEKNSRFTELLLHHAAEYGLRIRDEWKYTKDRIHGNRPVVDMKEFGYTAMETFWKMKKRPEGLLVYSDDLSSGITLSLYQNRIQVPEDVRLVIHRTVESGNGGNPCQKSPFSLCRKKDYPASTGMRDSEIARLRDCEVARLRSCEVAKLRDSEIAR